MPREKSAGAVIFRKENNEIYYLLLHYESGPARNATQSDAGGHWDFPKGKIEKGEKEEETVKREVKEETGIKDVKIVEGFKEWIKYFYRNTYGLNEDEKKKVPWTFKIVNFYLAETETEEVKISFEHTGYKWLPYKRAFEQLTYKNAKEVLKKAHHYLTS
jgi:bis(5'-nucleosidyl)-tetraphosphatase